MSSLITLLGFYSVYNAYLSSNIFVSIIEIFRFLKLNITPLSELYINLHSVFSFTVTMLISFN